MPGVECQMFFVAMKRLRKRCFRIELGRGASLPRDHAALGRDYGRIFHLVVQRRSFQND